MHKNVIFICVNQFFKHSMSVSLSICLTVTLLQAGDMSWTFHSNHIKCSENIHCVARKKVLTFGRICGLPHFVLVAADNGRNWWNSTIIWTADHLVSWSWWIHRLGEFSEIIRKISAVGGIQPLSGILVTESTSYKMYILDSWVFRFLGTLANRPFGDWNMPGCDGFWPLSWILVIEYNSYWSVGFKNCLILARLAKFQASGSQRWPKLVVYDIWPVFDIFVSCLLSAFGG